MFMKSPQISHTHKYRIFKCIIGTFRTNCICPIIYMPNACTEYNLKMPVGVVNKSLHRNVTTCESMICFSTLKILYYKKNMYFTKQGFDRY